MKNDKRIIWSVVTLIIILFIFYLTKYCDLLHIPYPIQISQAHTLPHVHTHRILWVDFPIYISSDWYRFPKNVFIYIAFLMFYLLTFIFRKTMSIQKKSLLFAFFVSLLCEMYGFSLSMYLLYVLLGHTRVLVPYINPEHSVTFLSHTVRVPVLLCSWFVGIFLIYKGWEKIWASDGKKLVTEGIYAYIRHPQYLGLFILLTGTMFFFPTPFVFMLYAILSFMYYRLSRFEEKYMRDKFGEAYAIYYSKVPMFFPRLTRERNSGIGDVVK